MSILFIGAHPDDVELGCAGAICDYVEKNYEVYCYYMTNGEYTDISGNVVKLLVERNTCK